jgi:CDP-glucose 4,6-dehydratase
MENMAIVEPLKLNSGFWQGRRVLLTGHTGFKGTWLTLMLQRLGAEVIGVSLAPDQVPNMFGILEPWLSLTSIECDICHFDDLQSVVTNIQPQIVIHMAAQALVMDAYTEPVRTIMTNTMGTVHLLESLRLVKGLEGVLIVTSDKVYENSEEGIDFSESSRLGGHEAYASSKAAAEILTSAYQRTYFTQPNTPVLTARAGNVIGGGDWSRNRLIPDLWRSYINHQPVLMRNPDSVRPWQHVLDPVYGYLLYIQYAVANVNKGVPTALNFGPPRCPTKSVLELAEHFAISVQAENLWTLGMSENTIRESSFLSIDSSLAFKILGWKTSLAIDETIKLTCDWYKAYKLNNDMRTYSQSQIDLYADIVQDLALSS